MKVGYTEFSFGYAFTENLTRSANPLVAPIFPNLIQEGRLGYDVKIDLPSCPLYLQYKLPELMVRKSAAEISHYALPGISTPFFRTYLMKRNLSRQHDQLINLENRSPNTVYYAASVLQNVHAFNDAYSRAEVHRESVFFSPKQIGPLPDDKQHSIAFCPRLKKAWLCSEPREVAVLEFKDISEHLRDSFEDDRYSTLEKVARNLREELLLLATSRDLRDDRGFAHWFEISDFAKENILQRFRKRRPTSNREEFDETTRQVFEDLLISREIARVLLGVDLIIAQERRG